MKKNVILFLLVFFEGAFIMSFELLGSKVISPYFGGSFDVWVGVLSVILFSIALGYYAGSLFILLPYKNKIPAIVLYINSIWVLLIIFFSEDLMVKMADAGFIYSLIVVCFIIIGIPCFLITLIIPIIIQKLTSASNKFRIVGSIYSISSISGIVSTLFIGFVIIPKFGIKIPLYSISVICFVLYLLLFIHRRQIFFSFLSIFFFFAINFLGFRSEKVKSPYKLIYSSEGILGQFRVFDFYNHNRNQRLLTINNVPQNSIIVDSIINESMYGFVHGISSFSRIMPEKAKALILGMGAGSLAQEFINHGFFVDAVDLDIRYKYIGENYFGLSKQVNFFEDDARHFINICKNTYDIIVIDVTLGEITPTYMFTVEFFEKIKKNISPNGLIFINYSWYLNGSEGVSSRSIYKTLKKSGFYTYVNYINPDVFADIIFISSLKKINWKKAIPNLFNNKCCINYFLKNNKDTLSFPIAEPIFLLGDEEIFEDNISSLERMKAKYILQNRQNTKRVIRQDYRDGISIFE